MVDVSIPEEITRLEYKYMVCLNGSNEPVRLEGAHGFYRVLSLEQLPHGMPISIQDSWNVSFMFNIPR